MSPDYEYATIDVDILVHPKAIAAGIEAMGLWLWSMAWSHKTGGNGFIPRHAPYAAWAAPRAAVDKLARRLVASGLWLERPDGWDVWNYGKKNQSAEEKERRRAQARERMKRFRAKHRDAGDARDETHSDASRDAHVHDESAAVLCNGGSSGSSSPGESAREGPPAWFGEAVATASMAVGDIDDVPARWHSYAAARKRKGWSMNREDAVGWLCDVVRSERARKPPPRADTRQPLRNPEAAEWMKKAGGDL